MELDAQQQHGIGHQQPALHPRHRRAGLDAGNFTEQRREDIQCHQDQMKTAQHQHHHARTHLPDPQPRFEVRPQPGIARRDTGPVGRRGTQAARQGKHFPAFAQLGGNLAAGKDRMNEEQRQDDDNRRLGDVDASSPPASQSKPRWPNRIEPTRNMWPHMNTARTSPLAPLISS